MSQDITQYLRKVVYDAHLSEHRPIDFECEYFIIDGTMLFAMRCPYTKVRNRIAYRLENNLPKRNLKFQLVYPSNDVKYFQHHDFDIIDDLDPNYSIALCNIFGKFYTIRAYADKYISPYLFKYDENGSINLNKLKEHGFDYMTDINYKVPLSKRWEKFKHAYEELHGIKLTVVSSAYCHFGGKTK